MLKSAELWSPVGFHLKVTCHFGQILVSLPPAGILKSHIQPLAISYHYTVQY